MVLNLCFLACLGTFTDTWDAESFCCSRLQLLRREQLWGNPEVEEGPALHGLNDRNLERMSDPVLTNPWKQTSSLPVPVGAASNPSFLLINPAGDRIICVPAYDPAATLEIFTASIKPSGDLGDWKVAGCLPVRTSATSVCAIWAPDGWLYIHSSDNNSGVNPFSNFLAVKIDSDGHFVGKPVDIGAMDYRTGQVSALHANGRIFQVCAQDISGNILPETRSVSVSHGSRGPWQLTTPFPGGSGGGVLYGTGLLYGDYFYFLGGTPDEESLTVSDVYSVQTMSDGTMGPWKLVGTLPAALAGGTCIRKNDRIVVLGGFANPLDFATLQAVTYTAQLLPNGNIGPFVTEVIAPPVAWGAAASATNGRYLYVGAGQFDGTFVDNRIFFTKLE